MKKAFVTGANGFVGTALVKELTRQGVQVTAMVRSENETRNALEACGAKIVFCDLAQMEKLPQIVDETGFDVFYHLAWIGSAGPSRTDSRLQLDNAQYTVQAVNTAVQLRCKRFVGAGSIMEYETNEAANTQRNRLGMAYIYGGGKLVAHVMSKAVAVTAGIEHVWPMITNAYGPGELSPRFVNTTLRKMIHREPLRFTAATQNYDFVYIDDVARAFYLIGEKGKPFCQYLIGSGNARPLKEFILEMQQAIAPEQQLLFGDVPFTGTNLPLSFFNCEDTFKDTGFCPTVSFVEGAGRTMEWLKKEGEVKI